MQRVGILALWHLIFTFLIRGDFRHEKALIGLARNNGRFAALPSPDQGGEIRHHVIALGLRGLMTAIAIRLKERTDFLVKTDRLRLFISLLASIQWKHKANQGR